MIKNIGQVSGLWIGNYSPQNTTLIWFDTGNNIHKTYDYSTGVWIPISMNPIVNKTYAELQSLAAGNNIAQGTFYRITDLGYLSLAITSTKIQYVDNNNNFIVDDLIATKMYCVTSSNLLIDDLNGVWDSSTNTLKFNFYETAVDENSDNDFIFGSKLRSGVHTLSKYKLKNLVSSSANNALSWNKGVYLNFLTKLQSYYNQNGGVVRYETYTAAMQSINQSLNALQTNINNINIWNKTIPSPFSPSTTPTNVAVGDTLKTALLKIQSWINKFKNAKGIVLSSDYAVDDSGAPAIGDTVEQAIGKIQYEAQGLPQGWTASTTNQDPTVVAGDTFAQAFAKVQRWFNLFWHISTSRFWSRQTYDGTNPVFDFNSYNGSVNISRGNDESTVISCGQLTQVKKIDYTLQFGISGQLRMFQTIGNSIDYGISSWSTKGGNGTVDLITYNTVIKEPTIPTFDGINENQDFVNSGCYALFAESILSKVRATKFKYLTFDSDIDVEISRDTPEYLIIRSTFTTGLAPDVNFKVNEVRDGQIINVFLISGQSDGIRNITFSKSSDAPNHMTYAFVRIYPDGTFFDVTTTYITAFTQDYRIMKLMCFHRSREASPISDGTYTDTVMLLK